MLNKTAVVRGTVANGTAAYAAGEQVGAAVAFSDWSHGNTTGNIMDLDVVLLSGYATPLHLFFWNASPTLVADNAAGTFTVANQGANRLGQISIAATDWTTVGGHFSYTARSVGLSVQSDTGIFYMSVLTGTGGTPTFNAASHIVVTAGILQDG